MKKTGKQVLNKWQILMELEKYQILLMPRQLRQMLLKATTDEEAIAETIVKAPFEFKCYECEAKFENIRDQSS